MAHVILLRSGENVTLRQHLYHLFPCKVYFLWRHKIVVNLKAYFAAFTTWIFQSGNLSRYLIFLDTRFHCRQFQSTFHMSAGKWLYILNRVKYLTFCDGSSRGIIVKLFSHSISITLLGVPSKMISTDFYFQCCFSYLYAVHAWHQQMHQRQLTSQIFHSCLQ